MFYYELEEIIGHLPLNARIAISRGGEELWEMVESTAIDVDKCALVLLTGKSDKSVLGRRIIVSRHATAQLLVDWLAKFNNFNGFFPVVFLDGEQLFDVKFMYSDISRDWATVLLEPDKPAHRLQ